MMLQVVSQLTEKSWVVVDLPKSEIAGATKKGADLTRRVVVVDVECVHTAAVVLGRAATNCANSTLRSEHRLPLLPGDPVPAAQVPVPSSFMHPVSAGSRLSSRPRSVALEAPACTVWSIVPSREAKDRLDDATARASLRSRSRATCVAAQPTEPSARVFTGNSRKRVVSLDGSAVLAGEVHATSVASGVGAGAA